MWGYLPRLSFVSFSTLINNNSLATRPSARPPAAHTSHGANDLHVPVIPRRGRMGASANPTSHSFRSRSFISREASKPHSTLPSPIPPPPQYTTSVSTTATITQTPSTMADVDMKDVSAAPSSKATASKAAAAAGQKPRFEVKKVDPVVPRLLCTTHCS